MTRLSPGPFRKLAVLAASLAAASCSDPPESSPLGPESAPPQLLRHWTTVLDAIHPTDVLCTVQPDDLDDDLCRDLDLVVVREYEELEMVKVRSASGLPARELAAALEEATGSATLPDILLEIPESRSMSLAFNDGRNSISDAENQTFYSTLRVREAHDTKKGKKRVAIIDTGIDPDHVQFEKKFKKGYDYVDDDTHPFEEADGVDNDNDGAVDEAHGHGTHIAGLINLVAPKAELYAYRVLDADGRGTASDVTEAVMRAIKDKADVINLSLGMYTDFEPLHAAIREAVDEGILVVASMGNDGAGGYTQYPAAWDEVIAVGSVDELDALSGFSNVAPYMDAVAPGEGILSCMPGSGYAVWSGTSQATAIVSGLAALLRDEHGKRIERTPALRQVLQGTGVQPTGLPLGHGARRIDCDDAIRYHLP